MLPSVPVLQTEMKVRGWDGARGNSSWGAKTRLGAGPPSAAIAALRSGSNTLRRVLDPSGAFASREQWAWQTLPLSVSPSFVLWI